jgi:uncharacterized protein (TIGR03083 family)
MTDVGTLIAAMTVEGDDLDRLVAPLEPRGWRLATPAAGWTVAHQIAHLAWTDEQAIVAATDPGGFGDLLARAAADPEGPGRAPAGNP